MLQINLVEHQIYKAALKWFLEIVKIMAPLRNNPWDPNEDGFTPIVVAVFHEHIEIHKMLASLADNPNAPNRNGGTPIH